MILFFETALFSAFLIIINIFFLKKNILLDIPNIEKHKKKFFFSKNVPKSLGLILILFILLKFDYTIYEKILILLIFFLGVLSDIKKINSPNLRFFIQAILIISFLLISQNFIESTRIPFVDYLLKDNLFKIFLTLICILIIINGSNFIDGLNTLCLGYYLSVSIVLYFLDLNNLYQFNYIQSLISIIIILFLFNFFGKSFLGDGGSYLLGFFFSIILIKISGENLDISPWFIAILLWYPAFEILFTIIRRSRKKKNPFLPDNGHFHQLLYIYLKRKFNINNPFLNPVVANIINIFNLFIFLLSLKFYSHTLTMVIIFFLNCLIYLVIYFLLNKNIFNKKNL